jgi:hypothetical protein
VIARLVDRSLFHEVLPARRPRDVHRRGAHLGLWVGSSPTGKGRRAEPGEGQGMRPGGALYREGIAKLSSVLPGLQ